MFTRVCVLDWGRAGRGDCAMRGRWGTLGDREEEGGDLDWIGLELDACLVIRDVQAVHYYV